MKNAEYIANLYASTHQSMCRLLEQADGNGQFHSNPWKRELGYGDTCVMTHGRCIEKAGLNFSYVSGKVSEQMKSIIGETAGQYAATGISSIIHPHNPFMPVIHMNVRYFELDNGNSWFGGGIDLTPHYIDKQEAHEFHLELKNICDQYHPDFYLRFKKWADDYFFLPHRNETRGIGGIFFDHLQPEDPLGLEKLIPFTTDLAYAYPQIYRKRIEAKASLPFDNKEKQWQQIRRGRYVEFNLLYDKGTRFGLVSGGNTESILISLPPEVSWEFNNTPETGTAEWSTLQLLKKGIDWIK